mgnify:CR=1 FL=1
MVSNSFSSDKSLTMSIFLSNTIMPVIYMKSLMNLAQDDRIEATYRFVPRGKNAIIRSTLD